MKANIFLFTLFLLMLQACGNQPAVEPKQHENSEAVYFVAKSDDFTVTGDGSAQNWQKAQWLPLTQRRPEEIDPARDVKVKIMYSETGMYCLFDCTDKKITVTMDADFSDLWTEDVVEAFFWTDEAMPTYFEYEISPLDYELPILVSNNDGELLRWQPFYYEENRQTQHAVTVRGGEQEPDAEISGWTAEFFIPHKLLLPLNNVPPATGSVWRANFYRLDYDEERSKSWSWQLTRTNFHDYTQFGSLIFE